VSVYSNNLCTGCTYAQFCAEKSVHDEQSVVTDTVAAGASVVIYVWLAWYFLNTTVTNEVFSVIFHLPDYKAITNNMQHQKSH